MRSSDPGLARFLVLAVLGVLGASCARGPGSGFEPHPQRLVPAWGLNTEAVPVVIQGDNFRALPTQHVGGGEPVTVDEHFDVFLGDVALEDVTLEDEHTLRARVPAGLAPGWRTLAVVGPLGDRVELPRAYYASDRRLAQLGAQAALEQQRLLVGGQTRLRVSVLNEGETAALAVTPVLSQAGDGTVRILSEPAPTDIGPGARVTFQWVLEADAVGSLRFQVEFQGHEETLGVELTVPAVETEPLLILSHSALTASFNPLDASINLGQQFDVELVVSNLGDAKALGVKITEPSSVGSGQVMLLTGPEPASADIPGKGSVVFHARLVGTGEGSCVFRAGASGTDELAGDAVTAVPVDSSAVSVQRRATLAARFSAPIRVTPGSPFDVKLTVTNTGGSAVTDVVPVNPRASNAALVTPIGTAPSAVSRLAGAASTTFTWSYRAIGKGRVSFVSSVQGTDANTGTAVSSGDVTSNEVSSFLEVEPVRADPFQDGSAFAQVFPYGGRLVLGPNRNGTRAVSIDPDGTADSELTFSFQRDTTGNTSQNTSSAPFSSIGATGCTRNTASCGPDNEDGRGFFFAGQVGTQEWLGIGGARSQGDLDYIHLTQDTGGRLGMRFVDLSAFLGGQTRGFSSAFFFHDRLYLGFPDTGGSRPYLVVVKWLPTAQPGYDASSSTDAENLDADKMPDIGVSGKPPNGAAVQMIDTLAAFNDRLYVVNNGGCMRSTTPTPRAYGTAPGDWARCTPALAAWSTHTSRTTSKTADLEPADKAVPQLAVFQGRLYLARNTPGGPQLFGCDPTSTGSPTDCEPEDWFLVAPNSTGDTQLTQFDNAANGTLSLLVATSRALYVGFDNLQQGQGAVVLRTASTAPLDRSDFTGRGGCSATQHPTGCAGLGGFGLGVGATRIFDGVTLGASGADSAWLTAGDGGGPVQLLRLD